jgi:hypothetical protein
MCSAKYRSRGKSAGSQAVDPGSQAGIDAASRSSFKNNPGFGLSGLAGRQQIGAVVGGMDLHREHLVDIEELEEQRKSAKTPRQLSHQLLGKLAHQLADGCP